MRIAEMEKVDVLADSAAAQGKIKLRCIQALDE